MNRLSLIFGLLFLVACMTAPNSSLAGELGQKKGFMVAEDMVLAQGALRSAGYNDLIVVGGQYEVIGRGPTNYLMLYPTCQTADGRVAFAKIKLEGDPKNPNMTVLEVNRK